jgi:VCBS repeat-containing protein
MRLSSLSRSDKRRRRERSTRRRMFLEHLERREVLTGLPPAVMNDAFSVNPDQTLSIEAPGILENDSDAEGDVMSAVLFSGPQHGSLSLNADGSFDYTPEAGFTGLDSFVYRADDGTSLSGLAAVTIRIETNAAPVAADDSFNMSEGSVLSIGAPGVLTNDSDADGDALSATLVDGPDNGIVTLNADGSFDYTPNADFIGTDTFTYTAGDGSSESAAATVTINVNAVNAIPEAGNDTFAAEEDVPLNIDAAGGLLANDSDADGDALNAVLVSGPAHGSLTLNADGSFSYVADENYNGIDGFSYLVNDGTDDSDVATVTLNISAVNDLPVASNDEHTTEEDTALTIAAPGILENDTDVDGDPLSSVLVSGPASGTLAMNPDGSFTYTPNADFNGVDGFSYKVSDGAGESDVATVTINVTPVNDVSVAADDAYSTDEDATLTIAAAGVLENDSDADGDPLTAVLASGPANGTVTLNADGSFEYIPTANFSGTDSFTYVANDGSGDSVAATVTITVNAVNDAPTGAADDYATDEDTTLSVDAAAGVLANDTDLEGDAMSAVLVTGPANGTLTLNADGSFEYVPNANFSGSDTFTYKASDGTTESAEQTVTITVNSVNDLPAAADDLYATEEDTALTIDAPGVLANDTDAEGDAMSAVLVNGPTSGTLTLNADGSFVYTPNADFSGTDSFTYTASDGSGASSEATVTINVNSVNDAPVAANDEFSTDEDVPVTIAAPGILSNDTDIDGDALSSVLVTGPTNGTLSLNPDGSFTYTPNADFRGVDGFSYQVSDGAETSDVATVTINVCPVNDAPAAADDSFSTDEDTALSIAAPGVLTNDSDVDGDPLSAVLVAGPTNGTLTLNADGSFEYMPNADFSGSDSFTYKVSDGSSESGEATVAITVNPVNDGPTAADDAFSTDEDTELVIAAPGVLGNDTDPEGDALTAVIGTGPTNGTVTMNADGSFTYTPNADFSGTDTFTYKASDGTADSAEATVTITVNAANDAPTAADDAFSTDEDTDLVIAAPGVLGNDTDPEGDALTAVIGTGPTNGTVTMNADGSFTYTPNADFSGTDTFTYKANDGAADSPEATVTITVNAANDAPTAADDAFSTDENTELVIAAPGVLGNDTDPEGDALTAVIGTGPTNGTVTMNADGSFTYTPNAGFSGTDTFTYKANDGTADSAEATVTITVNDVNTLPTARNDAYSMAEDTTLSAASGNGVLRNDTDPEGDPLSAIQVDGPSHGSLTLNADGSFDYTPDENFHGQDTFTYQASDGSGNSQTVTVTINVNPLNDTPVAADDDFEMTEGDDALTVDAADGLLLNDVDADGDALTATLIDGPDHGSVTVNADGSFTYTPEAGFVGEVSFTYQANDGQADSNVAQVNIVIGEQVDNEVPESADDAYTVISGNTLTVDAPGVLENDTDADGDAMTAVVATGPANGTLTLNADGSFAYTPNAGFTGLDTFTYVANDGSGDGNVSTVSIDVQAATPVPRNVAGVNDRYVLDQDTTLTIAAPGVLTNDADADGDPLSTVLFSNVQNGTLTLNADGSFEYTPNAGFTGTDSFVYRATDGTNFSLLTAVTLRVMPVTSPAPSPSPIPEPTPDPCSCDSEDENSGDDLIAPQSDPADSLAIVEGDAAEDTTDLDDLIDDVVSEEEEEDSTGSVDDFFTTVGSCA